MSSGSFAGEGAAAYAQSLGPSGTRRDVQGFASMATGIAGANEAKDSLATEEYIRAVQAEVMPYDRNLFRTDQGLRDSLSRLDELWQAIRQGPIGREVTAVKRREAQAMLATARWMYRSAQARTETRGMHKRIDYPDLDASQRYRLITSGLDEISVRAQRVHEEAVSH